MILEFNPISKRFQSPKHVIKAKDPGLALIDVAVLGFLTHPPPSSTQDAQLPAPLAAKLLYSQEQPIPCDDEGEERAPTLSQEDLDRNFEVFYQKDPENLPPPTHLHLPDAFVSAS